MIGTPTLLTAPPEPVEQSVCAPVLKAGVTRLALVNFRSHAHFVWEADQPCHVALIGPNGSGKTNILEALSLLSPGRGLRRAKPGDLQKKGALSPSWGLCATLKEHTGPVHLSMRGGAQKGRQFEIDDTPLTRQMDIQSFLRVFWLTPELDLLFRESMSVRRRFLDRLLMTVEGSYAPHLLTYEKLLREWRTLLEGSAPNTQWLGSLEQEMSAHAAAVTLKRAHYLKNINAQKTETLSKESQVVIHLTGHSEKMLCEDELETSNVLTERLSCAFQAARSSYQKHRPLTLGPSATQIHVTYKNKPIEQGSTGEQKCALFSWLLSTCQLQLQKEPQKPLLLLLDDFSAHLDQDNTQRLLALTRQHTALQMWLSGTENQVFESLDTKIITLPQRTNAG